MMVPVPHLSVCSGFDLSLQKCFVSFLNKNKCKIDVTYWLDDKENFSF